MDITGITFALIAVVFTPGTDTRQHVEWPTQATADVVVLHANLTSLECMGMLQTLSPDAYGDNAVLACSFNYDF